MNHQTMYRTMLARMYRDARIHTLKAAEMDPKSLDRPHTVRALGHFLGVTCTLLTTYVTECHTQDSSRPEVEQMRRDACALATLQHRMIDVAYKELDSPDNLRRLADMFGEKALYWRNEAGLTEAEMDKAA